MVEYTDIIDGMSQAAEQGQDVQHAVIDEQSEQSLLNDDYFLTGHNGAELANELDIQIGSENKLVLENGSEIQL